MTYRLNMSTINRYTHKCIKIIIITSIFRLGCCLCPIQCGWQHQAMSTTSFLWVSVLRVSASQATCPDISPDTCRPCLSRSSFPSRPGSGKSVTDLIQGVARCTCPYHLSRPLRCTAVISLMPNFLSSEAEGVSSWTLVPQIQRIMAWLLRQIHFKSKMFGHHFSLPWRIAEPTHAMCTLPRTLGERWVEERTGNSFLNFPQTTLHLAAMALP